MANQSSKKESGGVIKQGSIAQFMRKRTQLVGFDFGLYKHTQYAIEFMDNSLDAIESFHWKQMKRDPKRAFALKDDVLLENFKYKEGGVSFEDFKQIQSLKAGVDEEEIIFEDIEEPDEDDLAIEETEEKVSEGSEKSESEDKEGKGEGEEESGEEEEEAEEGEEDDSQEDASSAEKDEEIAQLEQFSLDEKELEKEVVDIMDSVQDFIGPVEPIVDREPIVIYQLTEREAPSVYADMSGQSSSDSLLYTLRIFDNGTGMTPEDLEKFGKYLASSKSIKLKQTRGSQGFGAPSAFSDAQNTTGQPIKVVSKHADQIYGICSEFYTTSKNKKSYVVPPTEVECPFSHGTYIELRYLNVKYIRGYVDKYINRTALTNPHVNLIYLDPNEEEETYTRKVDRFPREPTYAKPHPSSVNIGDFQDVLRNSDHLTISACIQDNYVRMSSRLAKKILKGAEFELEKRLDMLNLGEDKGPFITWLKKKNDKIYYTQNEKRVYGRSKRKRDIFITYEIVEEEDKETYWKYIGKYNDIMGDIKAIKKKIKKEQKKIKQADTKKEKKKYKRQIRAYNKKIKANKKDLDELKDEFIEAVKGFTLNEENEIEDDKLLEKRDEKIEELVVEKTRPAELSQNQTECLFKAFRAQNYMSPPKDPAVPIGASILETTLMKEFNLSLSYRTDLFGDLDEKLPKLKKDIAVRYVNRILSKFKRDVYYDEDRKIQKDLLNYDADNFDKENYSKTIIEYEVLDSKISDDFIVAETRKPTSGKGLAFVVEAAMAISPKIRSTRRSIQSLMRYVNRTPKLRDNADCAIWRAVQDVNWKLYKLDTFDNGIPKGNLRLLVNVSGPYVHLMFKSQSKNALAEDKVLIKEMVLCLQALGRKVRTFQNKKKRRRREKKRSKTIGKFIPLFVNSLVNVAKKQEELSDLEVEELEKKLFDKLEGNFNAPKSALTEENEEEEDEEIEEEDEEIEEEDEGEVHEEKGDIGEEEQEPEEEQEEKEKETKAVPDQETLIEMFEEEREGKHAIWRGQETKAFQKWKDKKLGEFEKEPESKEKKKFKKEKEEKETSKEEGKGPEEKEAIEEEEEDLDEEIIVDSEKAKSTPHKIMSVKERRKKLEKERAKKKVKEEEKGGKELDQKALIKLFEEEKEGKHAIWRGKETITFQKWKEKKLKERKTTPQKKKHPSKPKKPTTSKKKVKKPSPKSKAKKSTKQKTLATSKETKAAPKTKKKKKLKVPKKSISIISDEDIVNAFEPGKWYNLKDLITKIGITDMNNIRFLQLKLKSLLRSKELLYSVKKGKNYYKIKK